MNNQLFLTNAQFLEEFRKRNNEVKQRNGQPPFCWIAGSGASAQSGIPMGRTLAERWLKEMHQREMGQGDGATGSPIDQWAEQKFAQVPGFQFERAANYLPYIYHERYHQNPQDGCREIEKILDNATMSFGYSVLAYIMTNSPHRIAITTYFDDLIFNAIATYAGEIPLSCGYESVMRYVNPAIWKKPLIAKLQRDLMLAPKGDVNDITLLPTEWEKPLNHIFEHYTPIVIGYGDDGASGGNLMSFLEKLSPIKNGLFWCYRESAPNVKPAKDVQDLVARLGGHLVPILGFDELMIELWDELALASVGGEIKERSDKLIRVYRTAFSQLTRSLCRHNGNGWVTASTTRDAAKRALDRWVEDDMALA